MATSTTKVTTENAIRYLQQLCKHWSHKYDVTFDAHKGHISFGNGQLVDLTADAGVLSLAVTDVSSDATLVLNKVVEDHLRRFAFREQLDFTWGAPR